MTQTNGSIHLDMWTAVSGQLQQVGVWAEHIELSNICTACHTDEFYSHRAEKGKTGRFASLIVLQSEQMSLFRPYHASEKVNIILEKAQAGKTHA